ncbi:MAG: Asp-tRNA(Asn)/Glu-tRNA(Gln) amidotransferase subunit GatC [Patescibacteria group bacterium]|jgi:aspartyl-tRNA(Asn)/glutamyl-tRNA(Gln) amidotransferase subunit C
MALTREDIVHIAKLARLELSEQEIARYQGELSKILDYIGELQQVDTTGVEATAQVTGLTNRLAEDKIQPVDEARRQRLVDAFPLREGDYLKVKTVFE